jgi:hypothetical protein
MTPDYYLLADWDGREFWEFYRDECEPIVRFELLDGEKHALTSACEHLFRRGMKGNEDSDLAKYRWWLNNLLHGYQADDSVDLGEEHAAKKKRAIVGVLALVELRRMQKLNLWAELGPMTPQDVPRITNPFYENALEDAS